MNKQSNRLEKERQKLKNMLQSIPDPYDVNGGLRPEITANKFNYILLRHSQRLNKLTWSLIVLTAVLALVTIADIFIRIAF